MCSHVRLYHYENREVAHISGDFPALQELVLAAQHDHARINYQI